MRSLSFDTIVVGAGASGLAAAIAASRSGANVALIERNASFGGLATSAHVGTICGLYPRGIKDSSLAGEFANEFVDRLQAKQGPLELKTFAEQLFFLPYQSPYFENVCDQLLREAEVSVFLHATCCSATDDAGQIKELQALVWNEQVNFSAESFVDATGEGLLSLLLKGEMLEDSDLQAPGFVLGVSNLKIGIEEKALSLVILKELVAAGRAQIIPEEMTYFSVVPGSLNGSSAHLKLALPFQRRSDFNEISELERFSRQASIRCFEYLQKNIDVFRDARISFLAPNLGVRSGRRALGLEVLSTIDVLSAKKFKNSAANGLWPIEFWDGDRKAKLEYFEDYYQIPKGALISKSFANLFFCGRGISAEAKALSSARVIATSFATGFAAGQLAAS